MSAAESAGKVIRSTIPARLDRLSWSPFHTRMVAGLGAAWILDGLQITIASSVTGELTKPQTLGMSSTEIGLIASIYLIGEMVGALVFGKMSDRLGRKRLLITTLLLYLFGTGAAAFVTGHHTGWLVFFYLTRFVAGMGIGGQYAAINSAIDEMMPSRYRGRVDIWINGTYWAGAILGSFASLIFLNAFAVNVGWRLAFLMGPVLALVVIYVGRTLPESPRWLMTHGRMEEAETNLRTIEDAVRKSGQTLEDVDDSLAIELIPEKQYGYITFLRLVFRTYPKRAILGATLMITQSFLYNAIFFTYGLVLVEVLRRQREQGAPLRPCVLGRQPDWAASARAALRHGGPEEDDLGHVHPLRHAARDQRLALRQQRSDRELADVRLGSDLLLRLCRSERGLSNGQRDVADRDPRGGDRRLLCDRTGRRSARAPLLRLADRRRLEPDRALYRLSSGGRDHDLRRHHRDHLRDQRRGEVARNGHEAAHLDRGTGLGRNTGTRVELRVGCILDAALLQGGPR
jgi:MFS family permease